MGPKAASTRPRIPRRDDPRRVPCVARDGHYWNRPRRGARRQRQQFSIVVVVIPASAPRQFDDRTLSPIDAAIRKGIAAGQGLESSWLSVSRAHRHAAETSLAEARGLCRDQHAVVVIARSSSVRGLPAVGELVPLRPQSGSRRQRTCAHRAGEQRVTRVISSTSQRAPGLHTYSASSCSTPSEVQRSFTDADVAKRALPPIENTRTVSLIDTVEREL